MSKVLLFSLSLLLLEVLLTDTLSPSTIMKWFLSSCCLLSNALFLVLVGSSYSSGVWAATAAATDDADADAFWQPTRIAMKDLSENADLLVSALHEVGLVSLYGLNLPHWQGSLQECMDGNNNNNNHVQSVTMADGTVRTTLALEGTDDLSDILSTTTTTTSSSEAAALAANNKDATNHCQALQETGTELRHRVDTVLHDIALILTQELGLEGVELLTKKAETKEQQQQQEQEGLELNSIVSKALILEHFHQYQNQKSMRTTSDNTKVDDDATSNTSSSSWTLDWHIDQGLFLAFVPGMMWSSSSSGGIRPPTTTEGFHIQLKDGSTRMVHFQPQDELIIMVGDATEQIINPFIQVSSHQTLRALPHAFQMPQLPQQPETTEAEGSSSASASSSRLWYGRMVLPPSSAYHPSSSSTMDTYGDLREALNSMSSSSSSSSSAAHVLGCSSPHQRVAALGTTTTTTTTTQRRELQEELECNTTLQVFCWHRCMNFTDFDDISPDSCSERQLSVGCANEEGYLWPGDIHDSQFQLQCVNTTTAVNYTAPAVDNGSSDPPPSNGDEENASSASNHAAAGTIGVIGGSLLTTMIGMYFS